MNLCSPADLPWQKSSLLIICGDVEVNPGPCSATHPWPFRVVSPDRSRSTGPRSLCISVSGIPHPSVQPLHDPVHDETSSLGNHPRRSAPGKVAPWPFRILPPGCSLSVRPRLLHWNAEFPLPVRSHSRLLNRQSQILLGKLSPPLISRSSTPLQGLTILV